ncbi:MAG: helix-turn-helix transcriptional regulator [Acidimicrobiales bacterium]|nr:helix-turn-helix transcriptional regulator [Acidimicrobiales bacterium]
MPILVQHFDDDTPVPVGRALAEGRARLGISVETAAQMTNIPVRVLRDIEGNIADPTETMLESLSDVYGLNIEAMPNREEDTRVPARFDRDAKQVVIGWINFACEPGVDSNSVIIERFVHAIRQLRGARADQPVFIRDSDRDALAEVLDLSAADLVEDFVEHTHAGDDAYRYIVDDLRGRRLPAVAGSR